MTNSSRKTMENNNFGLRYNVLEMQNGWNVNGTVPRKDEFIDHTLLAPEFIRDPNNFIVQLIEGPCVFQNQIQNNSFNTTNTFATDFNFHNTVFQLVNLPEQLQVANYIGNSIPAIVGSQLQIEENETTLGLNERSNSLCSKETTSEELSFNSEFLNTDDNKLPNPENQPELDSATVPQFPSLSLLTPPSVELSDPEVLPSGDFQCVPTVKAKKVLPHKKRIARKLKVSENCLESILPVTLDEKITNGQTTCNGQFNCEICGQSCVTQLDFFSHLKQHYEPTSSDTILTDISSIDSLATANNCEENCSLNKKNDVSNVSSVYEGLNFEDFSNVDTVQCVVNQNNDMKLLNADNIDKCIDFVTQPNTASGIDPDEAEFSDTEDMLEGIRNVVDKVSVEDTCDEIDLITSSDIRNEWLNNNFSGITFKGEVSLEPLRMIVSDTSDVHLIEKDISLKMNDTNNLQLFSNDNCIDKETFENNCKEVNSSYLSNDNLELISTVTIEENVPTTVCINIEEEKVQKSKTHKKSNKPKKKRKNKTNKINNDCASEKEIIKKKEKLKKKKQWMCTSCDRGFNSANALKYHSRTHSGIRPHQCDICGRSFFAQGALKTHLLTHTGDKPVECMHCQRKFRQLGDLNYHIISIHTEEKSHQCEFCGKSFSRKYSLVVHRRIHTSEKNYKCDFCPKTFRASTYLQTHRKIHTGEKPHECKICSRRFRVGSDLRRHMLTHLRKACKTDG